MGRVAGLVSDRTLVAAGRCTPSETQLMVTEKVLAMAEAAATVAVGGSAREVVASYREKMQANAGRLRISRTEYPEGA